MRIGNISINCTACADDVALLSRGNPDHTHPPPNSPYALLLAFLMFSSTLMVIFSVNEVVLIMPRWTADSKRIELEKRGRKSSEVFILYLLFNI
jgi:hypothetical protein